MLETLKWLRGRRGRESKRVPGGAKELWRKRS